MTGPLDALDDPDYPAYTTGRAAEVLGVRQAFLRALDTAPQAVRVRGAECRDARGEVPVRVGAVGHAIGGCGHRADSSGV